MSQSQIHARRVLVIDDDPDILMAARLLLKRHVDEVVVCEDPAKIPVLIAQKAFDVVLLDMNFAPSEHDGRQGIFWLGRILELEPRASVVMITAHHNADIAVEAMKLGAFDFVAKPWHNEKLVATVNAALALKLSREENLRLSEHNAALVEVTQSTDHALIGSSTAMANVQKLISKVAPTEANVLITGENGTGKELVARALHQQSQRSDKVFVAVDVGALSETLFESELFGHSKGAFTGANQARRGRMLAANGGTLFLDEIGNIPLHLQAKLLTALEQRKVTPLGSNQQQDIDIRVLAATNLDSETLRDPQRFRQDLLYRLNTVEIVLPPLRERAADIPELLHHYLALYARKYRKAVSGFTQQAMQLAKASLWHGNVRALRHAVERAVILCDDSIIDCAHLLPESTAVPLSPTPPVRQNNDSEEPESFDLRVMEKQLITRALRHFDNNISQAAAALGLTRAALYRRMEKHAISTS